MRPMRLEQIQRIRALHSGSYDIHGNWNGCEVCDKRTEGSRPCRTLAAVGGEPMTEQQLYEYRRTEAQSHAHHCPYCSALWHCSSLCEVFNLPCRKCLDSRPRLRRW